MHFFIHQVYDRLPVERFGLSISSPISTSTPQETLKKVTKIPQHGPTLAFPLRLAKLLDILVLLWFWAWDRNFGKTHWDVWGIIPVDKWLGSPPLISHYKFGRGSDNPILRGSPWLLTAMILQVEEATVEWRSYEVISWVEDGRKMS